MSFDLLDQFVTARFDELLAKAAEGSPLLVRARRDDTLDRLTARAVLGVQGFTVETVDSTREPLDALLAAGRSAGADATDLGDLVASPVLRYVLFSADGAGAHATAWRTLTGAFATIRAPLETGPALMVAVTQPGTPAGCHAFDDGELIGPAECAVLARIRRPGSGLVAQAANAAAIEVARGDASLLDQLLELGEADRFNPAGWASRQPAAHASPPLRWRGEDAPCPILLWRSDPARFRRRVWRGHLGVLLPWLEEVRATFLTRFAQRLPGGLRDRATGEPIDVVEYEWGHIAMSLRPANGPVAAADAMRRLRNALAHGDPADWNDCRGIEAHARSLLDWRPR